VWEWKAESGGTSRSSLKRLGASCDWSRERFTMDEGLSQMRRAQGVRQLYKEGPHLQGQAPGELGPEVPDRDLGPRGRVQKEVRRAISGTFDAAIRLEEGSERTSGDPEGFIVTVATTRPETMLGDSGVAVHPEDERYKASGRQAGACCRSSAARFRSSPTTIPIPRRARAR
jgi:valyl-tRNA synthetase